MKRFARLLLALTLVFATLTAGSAASPVADDARSKHEQTIDFWTNERVSQAQPRDFVFDAASGRFIPRAPGGNPGRPDGGGGGGGGDGGGGGGGGDGDTATAGATWTNGGTVYKGTGKVLFELGGSYWVCSATVVDDAIGDRSLVLTAAHCVYDNEGGGEFASHWMFIPEYDSSPVDLTIDGSFCAQTTYGCWTAEHLILHDGFASAGGFNGNAILHDFAIAVVDTGGKSKSLVEGLGTQAIEFTASDKGTFVYSFGYPHAASFNRDLRYCAGKSNVDNRLFKLTYKLECDMTAGASGGAWYSNFDAASGEGTAMSVNSYGYSGTLAIFGPKFDANTAAVYNAAATATGDTIVP